MPVMGLSDRASLDPRFKEIGRIRKGAAKNGNRPGRDLDHFRYVPDSEHKESASVFEQIYGKEPAELEVRFPFDQLERVFGSWREAYGTNRLCKLRCDGARWHDWIKGDQHHHSEAGRECDLEYRDTEHRCPECPLQYVGRLSVMLEPMWYAGQIGIVTVITTSINDIANLSAKLVQWEPLTGKPFRLWRAPERIGVPIKGKRAGKDSDLLHLELAEDRLKLEFKAMERRAMERLEMPQAVPVAQIEAEIQPEYYGDPVQLADVAAYAPPYDEPTGDPFLDGKAQEDESKPPTPIAPEQGRACVPANWGELYERATTQNGDFKGYFENNADVIDAVKSLYESFTEKGDKTTIAQAWAVLWDHRESHQVEQSGPNAEDVDA